MTRRLRAVVCGTAFGQMYLEGLRAVAGPVDLVGVLGRGSERSVRCAAHYGVPLLTSPEQVDADLACVVVRSGLLGERGTELATALMGRGVHVLQEHPLHHDELAGCLRAARRAGVVYRLTSFYADLPPVARFLGAVRELLRDRPPVYVDAMCGFPVAYALLDLLATVVGGLRPYGFGPAPDDVPGRPFRSLDGRIGGVPVTLRLQNQLDPDFPDDNAHLLYRITVGTESGDLTLVGPAGPVVWTARPRIPRAMRDATAGPYFGGSPGGGGGVTEDDEASSVVLGPPVAPTQTELFATLFPRAAARAIARMHEAVLAGEDPLQRGQHHLTLCRMWQDITAALGPPELVAADGAAPLPAATLEAVAGAVSAEDPG